ncbi:MAG: acetyl-CoA carboxylase carboxyl transferase subunit alpha, partial [Gammaproteobacteria bacterium]|nr:acetyl-CoA carboxylase carboxyl transferase subunit alpha [Gammaproteobacteria bacterium]
VIGEGGSGGALAIGVADTVMMLQYSTYSVISPEGCASILWKSADRAKDAAEAMGITADRLLDMGLIDKVIREPLGGAHRNYNETALTIKSELKMELSNLKTMSADELINRRMEKIRSYGVFQVD